MLWELKRVGVAIMNFEKNDVKKVITEFIINNFIFDKEKNNVDENISLYEKGIIDSTGVLELVDFLEEKFEIRIEDDELIPDNLGSIVKITEFIMRKHGNAC